MSYPFWIGKNLTIECAKEMIFPDPKRKAARTRRAIGGLSGLGLDAFLLP
jgi:hypothetical protein